MAGNRPKTEQLIQVTGEGFEKVAESFAKLGETMDKAFKKSSASSTKSSNEMKKLRSTVEDLTGSVSKLVEKMNDTSSAAGRSENPLSKMKWSLESIAKGMEYLIQVQVRWYGTRLLLDTIAGGFRDAAVGVVPYSNALEMASAVMARHFALGGTSTSQARAQAGGITTSVRRALVEQPVSLADLGKATESFAGAGVAPETISAMTMDIAKLKGAFSEIDFGQFSLAVVGAFNIFKDQLGEGRTEAEKFRTLFEQILSTASVSVIRPENFTKVIQYLGQIGKISGFTTAELFSFAGALSNTSIPAANASRLLGGVMVSLSRKDVVANLNALGKQIGVTITPTKNLAENFKNVIDILDKLIKSGISLEKMDFLKTMVPQDRMKALVGIVQQYDEIKKIQGAIASSAGTGLDKVSDIMKAPVSQQWIVFKNILDEIGKSAVNVGAPLQQFMGLVTDIATGILVAVDSAGIFKDRLNSLGVAGTNAYNITLMLKTVFSALIDALSPVLLLLGQIIKGWTNLIGHIADCKEAMLVLSSVITATLIGMALAPLGSLIFNVGAAFAAWGARMAVLIPALSTGLNAIGTATAGVGMAFNSLALNVIPVLSAAIMGITALFYLLNKEMDKADKADAAWQAKLRGATKKTIPVLIAEAEKEQKAADAEIAAAKERQKAPGATLFSGPTPEMIKRKEMADFMVTSAHGTERKLFAPTPSLAKTGKDLDIPEEAHKQHLDKLLSNTKKYYDSLYAMEESMEKRDLLLLNRDYQLGIISTDEYYTARLKRIKEGEEKESAILKEEKKAVNEDFKDLTSSAYSAKYKGGGKERDAKLKEIADSRSAAMQALEAKTQQMNDKHTNREVTDEISEHNRKVTNAKKIIDAEMKLRAEAYRREELLSQNDIDMRTSQNAWLYKNNLRGATEYYSEAEALLDANRERSYQATYDKYQKEFDEKVKLMDALEELGGSESDSWKQMNEELLTINQKFYNDNYGAELTYQKQIKTLRQQEADDYKMLWEGADGFKEVTNKALTDALANYTNWGVMISNAWKGLVSGMQSEFEAFFTDGFKGTLKSFGDYVTSFFTMLNKVIAKLMAEQLTGYIGNIIKTAVSSVSTSGSSGSGIMGSIVSLIGGWFTSGSTVTTGPSAHYHAGGVVGGYAPKTTVPMSLFYNAPRLHGGLASDEYPAILQRGEEVTAKNQVGKGSKISVEIKNESGQDLRVKDSQANFNGQEYIVTVWLDALQRNAYGLRNAIGG